MEIRKYIVIGKVQGVGYRFFTEEVARSLSLIGWVQNMPDGSVECLAAGENSSLENFEKKIRKGPPLSRVVNMERRVLQPGDCDLPEDFRII